MDCGSRCPSQLLMEDSTNKSCKVVEERPPYPRRTSLGDKAAQDGVPLGEYDGRCGKATGWASGRGSVGHSESLPDLCLVESKLGNLAVGRVDFAYDPILRVIFV